MASDGANRYYQWLISEIGVQSNYHNHKETMAWVATAFYIPGIIVLGYQAPVVSAFWQCFVATLLFFGAACLVLIFVRTQFRLRQQAADIVMALMRLVNKFCKDAAFKPTETDIAEEARFWPKFVQDEIDSVRGEGRPPTVTLSTDWVSYAAIVLATALAIALALS